MKRLLSTALAVALLLSLGALAVLARGGGDILTPADSVVSAAAQPQTPPRRTQTAPKYNSIALPLKMATTLAIHASWPTSPPPAAKTVAAGAEVESEIGHRCYTIY